MITSHRSLTGSTVATKLLREWSRQLPRFVKVMPGDYRRVLEAQKSAIKRVRIKTSVRRPHAVNLPAEEVTNG